MLVTAGLSTKVQQALDTVRVIGNEQVHPGQIDVRDEPDTASSLFTLVNIIVRELITEPREVEAMYASLPDSKQQSIDDRDGNQPSTDEAIE